MLASGPAPPPRPHSPVRTRRAAAWACSIAFHLLVVYSAGRATWPVVESEEIRAINVVWLEDIRLPEPPPEPEPEPVPELQPQAESAPKPDAEVDPDADPERLETAETPTSDTEPPEEAAEHSEPEIPAPPESEESRRSRNYIVREIDWEEERRRAVERIGEEFAQEQNYSTFSLDDVTEDAAPEEPGPAEDIFTASSGRRSGPSLLTPGRSTGPIGRRLTALCDALGGISIFGIASICAAPGPEAALFAHLKPAYLLARPVCTEVPGAEAPTGSGSAEAVTEPVVKCRLVPKDELTDPEDLAVTDVAVREDSRLPPVAADVSD